MTRPAISPEKRAEMRSSIRDAVVRIARQRAGDFRELDPHKMAQIFWAAIQGYLARPINLDRFKFDNAEEFSSEMIEELMAIVLDLSRP